MQHPGWERFNKWTGHALAGALFLGALVFAAPWRVTLVLAYTFASSVGLIPRSITRSRWTRLLVGGLCILWPIWMLLPSDPGDYEPFRFTEERARLEQEYAVSDDQNAATTYARLLETSAHEDQVLRAWVEESDRAVLRRPWRRQEYPEIARWLDERQGMIGALKDLNAYRRCRFPVEPVLAILEPPDRHWKAVRAWAYMLTMAANLKAGEGDVAGALQLHLLTLRIADHHLQQFDVMDYLIGLAVERMAFNGINGIAVKGTPTPDELASLDALAATPSHEWAGTWRRIMRFECLSAKNSLCQAVYETNAEGKVRYSRRSYADYKGIKSPYQRSFNGKLLASGMWVLLPEDPWKFARRIDERYAQFSRIGQPVGDSASPAIRHRSRFRANHEYILDKLMDIVALPYQNIYDNYLRDVTTRRVYRVIVLLRQYKDETGRWPGSLDEIAAKGTPELWTDPWNGGSFVYRSDGRTFRLYSKGRNNIDENGKWEPGTSDDWSFWPPPSRNPEPQDADGV